MGRRIIGQCAARDEQYNELIVEVADPNAAVEVVRAALPH